MTRKDYIAIAGAIRTTQERIRGTQGLHGVTESHIPQQLRGVRRAAAHLAYALAQDNPRFNPARFLRECGYGAPIKPKFEECGCCGHRHRPEYRGDCRNDAERFSDMQLDELYGADGWEPVDLEEIS
jgi:hypothetical protein